MEDNDTESFDFDQQLIERFASGNGVVFVGAGISMRSGMPSWAKLMEPLREALGDRISLSASHLDVAELYETEHGRPELARYLKRELGDVRYRLTKTHDLIVSLPVQRIYTTNFDDLLERAAHKKGINRNVIYDASQISLSDTSTLSIVKLHGDLGAPSSLIISASDYYSYFTKNPAIADLLKSQLQTHTVLFLGYSFSDPDFGMILGKVSAQLESLLPQLYALQLKPKNTPETLAAMGLKRRGINVIPLDASPGTPAAHKEVERWLDAFLQKLRKYERRKHQHANPFSEVRDTSGIPKYKDSLIRRRTLKRIEEVLRADFPVIVVKGEPGIGKTQLVANATANMRVPGGAVVVNDVFENVIWIRSAGPGLPYKLSHILRTILNSLESFPRAGLDLEEMQEEADRMLEKHRVIVVIEDLEDGSESGDIFKIKEWLEHLGAEAHPRSKIVVTSRSLDLLGFMVEVNRLNWDETTVLLNEHANLIKLTRRIDERSMADAVAGLADCMPGNPQAIQLALGLISGTGDANTAKSVLKGLQRNHFGNIELAFEKLFEAMMEALKKPLQAEKTDQDGPAGRAPLAHQILRAMLAFPEAEPVPTELLRVACAMANEKVGRTFLSEAERCVQFGLLEQNAKKDTFELHRISKKLLGAYFQKEEKDKKEDSPSDRLADYLLNFLRDDQYRNVICRKEIPDEYWDALVRDQMSKVDPYWPVIRHVMAEASAKPRIIDFVLLLVHYMDSRFLVADRVAFLQSAIQVLKNEKTKTAEEEKTRRTRLALLQIDALAWTYMENNKPYMADRQIKEGLRQFKFEEETLPAMLILAESWKETPPAMLILAESWKARMASERNDHSAAFEHLRHAKEAVDKLSGQPWIEMRFQMISGDVWHRASKASKMQEKPPPSDTQKTPENSMSSENSDTSEEKAAEEAREEQRRESVEKAVKALQAYRTAENLAEQYGGEGDGYQISPRIAFALLDKNDKESREEAAKRFRKLVENNQLATGRLYGQYGLALIAAKNKATREAIFQLQAIHREIYHLAKENILMSLAENLYRETLKQRP